MRPRGVASAEGMRPRGGVASARACGPEGWHRRGYAAQRRGGISEGMRPRGGVASARACSPEEGWSVRACSPDEGGMRACGPEEGWHQRGHAAQRRGGISEGMRPRGGVASARACGPEEGWHQRGHAAQRRGGIGEGMRPRREWHQRGHAGQRGHRQGHVGDQYDSWPAGTLLQYCKVMTTICTAR